ncbi:putative mediator of RNA polymerase II transcription subunit 26b [Raphanus sativus]|uniref:Probable mediator of RNA polymerase II transcription subunit 26b n=1 Tax=Raphanus sativus TaxID=3726 RepID=A0A6J0KHW8_RAPSA|nr:probable mediator of RNA polymerase II transcription subunit 26b [Raphanus sativus]KAJ4883463.1 putative mediator of RNA polymerase II transcription subunit 26b [Raphanus sativus]
MKPPSGSLDSWREYFRRGDSDIFGIIDHAIMVAAADCPNKFKSRRDKIAELLFSCRLSRCTGCDHLELSVPGHDDNEEDANNTTVDGGGGGEAGGSKESKANSSRGDNNHIINETKNLVNGGNYSYDDEAEALSDAIEEFSMVSKEVCRIKEIFLNKDDESQSVILESLRKLKLMSLNVDILKSTEIGKAVNGLRKHASDKIRQLAKTLIAEWKEIVDQWVSTTKEIAGAQGTPESANPSVVDEEEEEEEEAFPSLPYDVDIFTPEANGFEMLNGDFFDSLDFDGNLCNSGEHNTSSREQERRPQNISKRRPEGTQTRIQDAPFRSIKPSSSSADGTRRPQKHNTTEQRMMKNDVVSVHNKSEKPMIPRRKPLARPQQEKLKGLDADAKFEFAKRKLQESYQHHENAKKQRTIQVLETIPKQGNSQKPQLKRPGMNNRNWANGRK